MSVRRERVCVERARVWERVWSESVGERVWRERESVGERVCERESVGDRESAWERECVGERECGRERCVRERSGRE